MSESEGLSTLANWMIAHGYATGHGDTAEDLLSELVAQVSGGDGMVRVPREPSNEMLEQAKSWHWSMKMGALTPNEYTVIYQAMLAVAEKETK